VMRLWAMSCRPRSTPASNQADPWFSSAVPSLTWICSLAPCREATGGFRVGISMASRQPWNRWRSNVGLPGPNRIARKTLQTDSWPAPESSLFAFLLQLVLGFCHNYPSETPCDPVVRGLRAVSSDEGTKVGQRSWLSAGNSLICLLAWVGPVRDSRVGPSGCVVTPQN